MQMANTTTAAAARRALAVNIKRSEMLLARKVKQAASSLNLAGLDADEIAELKEDGEI